MGPNASQACCMPLPRYLYTRPFREKLSSLAEQSCKPKVTVNLDTDLTVRPPGGNVRYSREVRSLRFRGGAGDATKLAPGRRGL